MVTFIYDGSFDGLLCCVFESYVKKIIPDRIIEEINFTPLLLEQNYTIATNPQHAQRVQAGIEEKIDPKVMRKVYKVFLSEQENVGVLLLRYIHLLFAKGAAVDYDYRNPVVLKIKQIHKQIHREVHRMHAFVRFEKTVQGLYYATVEPDFNVIPLIGDHFRKRYADQHWMIFDCKRNVGVYYDQSSMMLVEWSQEAQNNIVFMPEEKAYTYLWKNYFDSVNISERKNTKLHLRHMPKRYWKYLPEKH